MSRRPHGVLHHHSAGGGYTGPLDYASGAVVAFDQRAMSASLRGTALYTIADGAGGATQSFNNDATTGAAPVAAIQSYSATPFYSLWNDQSGNGRDASQSASAAQPSWIPSATNSRPGIQSDYDGGADFSQFLATAPITLSVDANTLFAVIKLNLFNGSRHAILGMNWEDTTSPGPDFTFNMTDDGANGLQSIFIGADTAGFTDFYNFATGAIVAATGYHLIAARWTNAGAEIYFDGVLQPLTTNTPSAGPIGTMTFPLGILTDDVADAVSEDSDGMKGVMPTGLLYDIYLADTPFNAIMQNIAAYYGTILL